MAGYSGTPLDRKLGIKPGMKTAVLGAPAAFAKSVGARNATRPGSAMDYVHLFTMSKADLAKRMPALVKAIAPAGVIWISWPKKAAKLDTDLDENAVRALALANGVVDVKVCAVDETWSGLKLVRRLKDR